MDNAQVRSRRTHLRTTRRSDAFTLIELIIVITIIALLGALLVPALARAREQARIVKCMFNQWTLAKAISSFAIEHDGYGQLVAFRDYWTQTRAYRRRYAFERDNPVFQTHVNGRVLSAWPVAYSPYLGTRQLRGDDCFVPDYVDPENALKLIRIPSLQCPSDTDPVGNVLFPSPAYGVFSYSINLDVFGTVQNWRDFSHVRVWRKGANLAKPLEGNLDRIGQPSRVLFSVDGGSFTPGVPTPRYISTQHLTGGSLSNYSAQKGWLPSRRHSADGGLCGAYADGHADYFRPVAWAVADRPLFVDSADRRRVRAVGQRYPTRYVPDPRITPFVP